jgi:endoglucanase
MKDLIKKLSETYGPAGREGEIARVIRGEVEPYVDETFTDVLGNLYAVRKGGGARIMVAAHMDEIGVIVTYIEEKGYLRFSNVGGVSPYVLLGQQVVFAGGAVGTVAMEKLDDIKKLAFDKMYIDIGAGSKEEASQKVRVGDMATYHRRVSAANGRIIGKAMDNRAGCAVLIKALQQLKTKSNTVYAVFTSQEEVGLRGARTASYRIDPDVGLAVDVTLVGDTPEPLYAMDVALGKGPAIKVKDNSVICHPRLKEFLVELAEKNGIPYQLEVLVAGGTDAGSIHLTREGIPSGVISIPCRYIHTPGEMVDLSDPENAVRLLVAFLEGPVDLDKLTNNKKFPCQTG